MFFIFTIIKRIRYKINGCFKKNIWKIEYGHRLKIGSKVSLRSSVMINIQKEGSIQIGDNTFFNNYCSLNSHGLIKIGNDCLFGENVKVYDHNHIFNTEKKVNEEKFNVGKVIIGNNCWIGSNVTITKGTIIGDNCTIAAGCVLNESIPDNSIVKREKSFQKIENIVRRELKK